MARSGPPHLSQSALQGPYDEGSGAASAEPIQRAVPAAASKCLDPVRENWNFIAVIPRGCRVKQAAKLMFLPMYYRNKFSISLSLKFPIFTSIYNERCSKGSSLQPFHFSVANNSRNIS